MTEQKFIKVCKGIYYTITIGLLSWFWLSFIEVVCKNLGENPQYCPLNFFEIWLKWQGVA